MHDMDKSPQQGRERVELGNQRQQYAKGPERAHTHDKYRAHNKEEITGAEKSGDFPRYVGDSY